MIPHWPLQILIPYLEGMEYNLFVSTVLVWINQYVKTPYCSSSGIVQNRLFKAKWTKPFRPSYMRLHIWIAATSERHFKAAYFICEGVEKTIVPPETMEAAGDMQQCEH